MTSIIVAIPARNEEERIGPCLDSVLVAAKRAHDAGCVARADIVVAAHRCTDRTAAIARERLGGFVDGTGRVLDLDRDCSVGAVRAAAVDAALDAVPDARIGDAWVFSTDADSCVPPEWITGMLDIVEHRPVARFGARGLVELVDWDSTDDARRRYAEIIAAGMRDGDHDHVYGANLVVRLDAYLDVGGFPDVPVGEDHALCERLAASGRYLPGVFEPVVRTAGRVRGRAAGGLGDLLARLDRVQEREEGSGGADGT